MKYLNKNIEEIGKKASEKTLISRPTSCGIFQQVDYNHPSVKNTLQNNKTL